MNNLDKNEASIAAVAFIREVIKSANGREHELPGSILEGYLTRVYEAAGCPEDGIDVQEAILWLIQALAQLTASAMYLAQTDPRTGKTDVDGLLSKLENLQACFVLGNDEEEEGPPPG